jgi:hypothetical protein
MRSVLPFPFVQPCRPQGFFIFLIHPTNLFTFSADAGSLNNSVICAF